MSSTLSTGRLPEIISTLKMLKNVVALAPLGENIGAGIELAISICEMAQSAKANRAAYEELGLRITALLAGISNVVQKTSPERLPSVSANIVDVVRVLTEARNVIQTHISRPTKSSRNILRAFKVSNAEKEMEDISALEGKISAALERFHIESQIRLELVTQHVTEMINVQMTRLAAIQESLSRDAEMARLDKISYIASARYDSDELQNQVMTCLEGTRIALLADLDAWTTSPNSAPFFWLNGLAGTGKSTVARTFCERLSKRKDASVLFASFFVSRHSTDRRKALNILHTLVYQLALQDDAIRMCVTQLLAQEPDLLSRSLSQQAIKLLGDSLARTEGLGTIVLVLDALDECEIDSHGREGGQLLLLLARSCSVAKRSVKLLVTSRLEPTIRDMFDEIQASTSKPEVVQLHDLDRAVVREDIHRYLIHSFHDIARRVKITDWPSKAQVNLLLDNADVLFIYAATVVRYIGHRQFDPRKRLEQVLMPPGNCTQSAYRQLDGLYQDVLANAVTGAALEVEDEPEIARRLQAMLGTVVLVLQRLSPTSISGLLNWSVLEVELTLARLAAVFIIHGDEPVRIFHPSFADFLLDSKRCIDVRLQVNGRTHHTILARHCLSVMSTLLCKDILDTGLDPLLTNRELNDLDALVQRHIPSHLQYAACFWMNHLLESSLDEDLLKALEMFCRSHLFHWLECISYLGKTDLVVSKLPIVTKLLPDSALFKELLDDLYHTFREYSTLVRDSAAHIYHSALVTMPSCRLYKMSSHETGDVVLRTSRTASFTSDVMYMQTNITDPAAFAMSPDGSKVACYQSDVLYIGDTNSGDMRGLNISHDLATGSVGHHLAIVALQFSFDGRRLFAADCWGSLRIMELDDEGSLTYLPPANNMDNMLAVSSAAFSSNGEYCVFNLCPRQLSWTWSGPEFQVVLRSMQPGAQNRILHDVHTDIDSSNSVFTPNSLHLIHANNCYIFVWDVARQTLHTNIAYAHSDSTWPTRIKSLTAISNTVCASMTENGIVDLWDPVQGTHLRTLVESNTKMPLNVFGLTCSSDGCLLGMVANTMLQLIDVTYGHIVTQHTLSARLVRYRHDRASIELDHLNSRLSVSGFPGHPIFIWTYDLAHAPRAVAPLTFLGDVTCVSFSTDGSLLVSGAEDGSITVLASDTGFLIAQYPGKGMITAALMSTPNSRFVLSAQELVFGEGSYDMEEHFVVQVNDSKTADDTVGFSKRYSIPCVYAVAISPDKQHLALWFNSLAKIFTATFDIHTGHAAACLPDQPTEDLELPKFIAYTPDGLTIVQTRSHTILLRNARTLVIRHILQGSRDEDPSSLALTVISPCSTRVGRISRDGLHMRLRVWSIESGSVLMTHHFQEVDHGQHWGLLNPIWTHNHLLYASRDSISTWNFDESTSAHTHVWPRLSRPKSMCASDDLSYIYAWCEDEHVRVWTTHGFHTEEPILEVAASRQWPQDVMRALWRGSLFSAAHYAIELRMIVPFEQRYLSVIINLEDGFCVQAIPFGDGQNISPLSQIPVSNRRMYMSSHGSNYCAKLVRRLAQIPFNKDDEAYKWIETVQDVFETLRHALLQVWNIDTGEMEAIITWNGTTTELEHIPPSFALRYSNCEVNLEKGLLQQYSLYDSCLRIYSDSPLKQVCKLGIPSGRRPTMSRHVTETADIAIHGNLVAIGSTHGTISIFDFSQAIKAAEARARVGSHVPSTSLFG